MEIIVLDRRVPRRVVLEGSSVESAQRPSSVRVVVPVLQAECNESLCFDVGQDFLGESVDHSPAASEWKEMFRLNKFN